ncbi:hypothetical protein BCR36DRAFT_412574 [Piromyces finnis]|uniref:ABC transporter domain-containing protein n=1 Tax=Piromyces finnis TaxID=1754191 RepID=A0A1Y1V991_9FUNG|nr:hypothetical protein BCR36DRAFT_412574 [Piromyces finnis]|eukprot:ORX50088.1 hypothetical protein BCR36DRAFT_412574 [Piromyces finnis]
MNSYINTFSAFFWKNKKINGFNSLLLLILLPYILYIAPKLTCYVEETKITELYTLNGYDINHCSESFDESFLFAFVLPRDRKFRSISNTFIDLIMTGEIFQNISPESYIYRTYYDEKYLNEIYKKSSRFIIGIIFNDSLFNYTIKIDKALLPPNTEDPIPHHQKIEKIFKRTRSSFFKQYGFLIDPKKSMYEVFFCPIQKAIDEAIIKLVSNNKNFRYDVNLAQFEEPQHYCEDNSVLDYHIFLPCIVGLFMILSKDIVRFILDEKGSQTKKAFVLSGINSSFFSLSWLIQYSVKFIFGTILITYSLQLLGLINNIETSVYIIIFEIYGMSAIGMAYLYSVILKKLKYAESMYIYLSIVAVLSTTYILNIEKSWRMLLSAIISPVGIISLVKEITSEVGITNHIEVKDLFHGDILIFLCLLTFSTILYFVVSIILEKILTAREVRKEYLTDYHQIIKYNYRVIQKNNKQIPSLNQKINDPIIEVTNISKKVKYTKKTDIPILQSVSFGIPLEGIYGIVGKPGSGIKTLMHIMLGNIKPDSGDILYNGKKLSSELNKIKKDIGLCSKYNNTFDGLTVEQNLIFMNKLLNKKLDINLLMNDMGLFKYKDYIIPRLSQVQKRILSIGMVLMAKQKYVFLEEPTKGLDTMNKKRIWEYINRCRKDRTIVVFTEDITEAEIYTEIKLIIVNGIVHCSGNNAFITNNIISHDYFNIKTALPETVDELLKRSCPKATLIRNIGKKKILDINMGQTWIIPYSIMNPMSEIYKILDKAVNEGIIKEYTISHPSLQDVYNRLDDGSYDTELLDLDTKDIKNEKSIFRNIPHPHQYINLYEARYMRIITKNRILNTLKNHKYLFWSVLIPISLVVFAFDNYEVNSSKVFKESETKSMNTEYFYNDRSYVWNYDINSNITAKSYKILKYVKNKANQDILVFDKFVKRYELGYINYLSRSHLLENSMYVSDVIGYRLARNRYRYDLIYNSTLVHSLPSTMNAISNSILYSKGVKQRISTSVKTFGYNDVEIMQSNSYNIARTFGYIIMISNIFFLYNKMKEDKNGVFSLYRSLGINKKVYFITTLAGDFVLATLLNFIILIMGIRFHNPIFEDKTSLSMAFNIMMLGSIVLFLEHHILSNLISNKKLLLFFIVVEHLLFIEILFYYVFDQYSKYEEFLFLPNHVLILTVVMVLLNPLYAVISVIFSLALISNYTSDHIYKNVIGFRGNILAKSELGVSFIFISISTILVILIFVFNLIYNSTLRKKTKKGMIKKSQKILEQSPEEVKLEYLEATRKCNDLAISIIEFYKEYPYHSIALEKDYKSNMKRILKYQYGQPHNSVYTNSTFAITCIENITFGVRNFEIFCLLGPPRSGKSFIVNAIASIDNYNTGGLYINGINKTNSNIEEIIFSYCRQEPSLSDDLTIKEHLFNMLDLIGYSNQGIKSFSKELLQFYGLAQYTNVKVKYLSYEQKKILNLMLIIAHGQSTILLDEPTKGISRFEKRKFIWDRIKQTNRSFKSSILITTNSLEEAVYLSDRVGIMSRGRLVYVGTFEQLKSKYISHYNLIINTKGMKNFNERLLVTSVKEQAGIDLEFKYSNAGLYNYKVIINSFNEMKRIKAILEKHLLKEGNSSEKSFFNYRLGQITLTDIYTELTGY